MSEKEAFAWITDEAIYRLKVRGGNDCRRTVPVHAKQTMAAKTPLYTKAEPDWQPIETAPKDTEILLGPTKRMAICVGLNCSRDGWVTETPSEWVPIYPPTHWMPLPEPPKDTTP